jgi:hypothetical protein
MKIDVCFCLFFSWWVYLFSKEKKMKIEKSTYAYISKEIALWSPPRFSALMYSSPSRRPPD